MKIAFLTNGIFPFTIGGMQKHSYHLIKTLAAQGHEVDVYLSGEFDETVIKDYFSQDEIPHIHFVLVDFPNVKLKFPGHYVYGYYLYSGKLRELLKQRTYTFIYAQGFTSLKLLTDQQLRPIVVSNLHGLEMFQKIDSYWSKLKQFALRIGAKRIISLAKHNVSLGGKLSDILRTQGASVDSIIELPNAIDASWLQSPLEELPQNNKVKLVFVGRYERRKGIQELHQALSATIDTDDYSIDFVGNIPQDLQFDHANVRYHGVIKETDRLKSILDEADVLVCPSYAEGMPTVILEAMSRKCAIIASNVGAVACLVDRQNGWLIESDIKESLTSILQGIGAKVEDIEKKKVVSYQKVKGAYTWDRVAQQTIQSVCSRI